MVGRSSLDGSPVIDCSGLGEHRPGSSIKVHSNIENSGRSDPLGHPRQLGHVCLGKQVRPGDDTVQRTSDLGSKDLGHLYSPGVRCAGSRVSGRCNRDVRPDTESQPEADGFGHCRAGPHRVDSGDVVGILGRTESGFHKLVLLGVTLRTLGHSDHRLSGVVSG